MSKADAGNGFLMRQGYTIAVSGWASVSPDMPGIGAGPFKLTIPVAVNADGLPIVGPAMEEYAVDDGKTEKGRLTYQTADSDTATASLMVRNLVDDQPTTIAADKWQFDPDGMSISLKPSGTKFEAGKLYEFGLPGQEPEDRVPWLRRRARFCRLPAQRQARRSPRSTKSWRLAIPSLAAFCTTTSNWGSTKARRASGPSMASSTGKAVVAACT